MIRLKVQALSTLNQLLTNSPNLSYQTYLPRLLKPKPFSKDLARFLDSHDNKPVILLQDTRLAKT